jgi:phage shock protein A
MEATDLSGMDPAAARSYVLGFLTTLRLTRKRQRELENVRRTWEERIRRAVAAGRPQLRDAARAELARVQEQLGTLLAEEQELAAQVEVLGSQLRSLRAQAPRTADLDQLLAELQALAGERDELAEELERADSEQRAAAELEALKRRLRD